MDHFKSAFLLICFTCLRLNIFTQTGDTINFNDYVPAGCSDQPILTIGLIADPQYCDCDPAGTRYYRETMWKLPRAVDTMNKYQVDFVMSLGDMIDRYYESFDSVSKHYENLNMPHYNLLGNHAFEEVADELKSTIVSRYGMPDYYYAFSYGSWRFLVLDGTELAAYTRYIHPDLAEEGDSVWNSVQGMINGLSWNGGISKAQQSWMRNELEDAVDSGQNVILFCHFPVYPDSVDLNLWNKDEIVSLLEQYPNVVAYINGHLHEGNYGYKDSIHYFTQAAMLDTPDSTAFAIMRIYPKEIVIDGYGRVPDRTLTYDNFKKKAVEIFLSDTLLQYSHLKNDLTGQLSFVSSDTGMLVNYMLDTTRYQNRYFRISHDSLLLNTDEDLSLITDLKINVIAVDCDADTFSQTFNLLFNTTVMRFGYQLPDTIISVYTEYKIVVDSLVEVHSKAGMDIILTATTAGVVTFTVLDDTLIMIPASVGSTEISIAATDQFTGKEYQQEFRLEIYDPLNHDPYHTDSVMNDYIIQLSDTLSLELAGIFIDPDGDLPDYYFTIYDTGIATGWLYDGHFLVSGKKAGTTDISITANDNRGGVDSVIFNLRVNTSPFHSDTITLDYIIQVNEIFTFDLHHLFLDPDNDPISFGYFLTDPAPLDATILNDSLKMLGTTAGITHMTVIADDNYGGIDTMKMTVFVNAGPVRTKEYTTFIYQFTTDCILIDLDSIFADPNGDMIEYQITSTIDSIGIDTSNHLMMCQENAGVYKIYLSLTDENGGFSEDSLEVMFNGAPPTLQQQYRSTNRLINDLKIFPNPTSDLLYIQFESITDVSFGIYLTDQMGRVVYQTEGLKANPGFNHQEIDIAEIKVKGLCFLNLNLNGEYYITKGVLIRHITEK